MIDWEERSAWNSPICLTLVGPGGAGKSSLGLELAPLLKRYLIDLDIEFQRRIGDISTYICEEGYARYKLANSKLAGELLGYVSGMTILVTSSGFLTPDNPPHALEANQRLVAGSYSICLLPSRDLDRAVSIIVERQMARPFASDRAMEEARIRDRYPVYARRGELIVFSEASAAETARAVALKLSKN